MEKNSLAQIRRVFGISVLFISLFSFTGLGVYLLKTLPVFSLQFTNVVLSILAGATSSIVILLILLFLTLLLGRIYCSTICPLGLLQDLILRIKRKTKPRKISKYKHGKIHDLLRYSILGVFVLALIGFIPFVLPFIDPYGNFGRIATVVFGFFSVNFYNSIIELFSIELPLIKGDSMSLMVIVYTTAFLATLVLITIQWGRVFCNTFCPVGTLLGLFSRTSVFKIKNDEQECIRCGRCYRSCKASCIDGDDFSVSNDRCVACFNCLEVCPTGSVSFKAEQKKDKSDSDRRSLIALFAIGLLAKPAKAVQKIGQGAGLAMIPNSDAKPAMPPGAISFDRLKTHCVGCMLCVTKCPSQVISANGLVYEGTQTTFLPTMDYGKAYCRYECIECLNVCPTGALTKMNNAQKKLTRLGMAVFIKENCVVVTRGNDCGACAEHCPTKAVRMRDLKNGLRLPIIDANICIGCGACQHACPTLPYKAIYVKGHRIQSVSSKFFDKAVQAPSPEEDFPF